MIGTLFTTGSGSLTTDGERLWVVESSESLIVAGEGDSEGEGGGAIGTAYPQSASNPHRVRLSILLHNMFPLFFAHPAHKPAVVTLKTVSSGKKKVHETGITV